MPAARPLAERFWEKVNKDGPIIRPELGPCWIWTAYTDPEGYGRIGFGAGVVGANRAAWFLEHGQWPREDVLHRCDNRPCVRIDHLFEGDQSQNMADMVAKGRAFSGPHTWRSRKALTAHDVIDIRTLRAFGARISVLAKEFAVSVSCVHKIIARETWVTI